MAYFFLIVPYSEVQKRSQSEVFEHHYTELLQACFREINALYGEPTLLAELEFAKKETLFLVEGLSFLLYLQMKEMNRIRGSNTTAFRSIGTQIVNPFSQSYDLGTNF